MERKDFIKILGVGALGLTVSPMAFANSKSRKCDKDVCQAAWDTLCGNIGKVYKTDGFTYVHPNRKPNVFLYGDSISIKYTSQVRKELDGKATVTRLFKNGGSSNDFISNMEKMNETMFQPALVGGWDFKWDLIHFNVGLHDLKYLKGKNLNKNGKQVSSIATYKTNLNDICKYLKKNYPKATLIFATTTPVPEGAKGRFKGDAIEYNKAAMEVLSQYPDIVINDLFSFTTPHHEEWIVSPGDVHYNKLGFTAHGKRVAAVIKENL